MQHLDYCRQLIEYGTGNIVAAKNFHDTWLKLFGITFDSDIKSSVKFILPNNGIIIHDPDYKGIFYSGICSIPFETIVIEYTMEEDGEYQKSILIVKQHGDMSVNVYPIFFEPIGVNGWVAIPSFAIRYEETGCGDLGTGEIKIYYTDGAKKVIEKGGALLYENTERCVLNFLNALACKNVHIEKSLAKSTKQGKAVKAALPFDDYHYLTIDVPGRSGCGTRHGGTHRSPREHLRRGHIRRLESGPIWVNATVVNAGIGARVGKTYNIRSGNE